jgi:hypothetical protein
MILCTSMQLVAVPPQPIGVATSEYPFSAGPSSVPGQATLFEGDPVRSQFLPTRLFLKDGSRYVLGIGSEGTIYRNHLLLRSGSAEVISSGKTSRLISSSISVTADAPGTAATVYAGKNSVTVLVRRGEVKVARWGSARTTTLGAGRSTTLRITGREGLILDNDSPAVEAARIQAAQVAQLAEAARDITCMQPRVESLTRTYAALAAQLAVAQSTRNALEPRMVAGAATPTDVRQFDLANESLRSLQRTTLALSEDLGGIFQYHHPGPTPLPASPHSTHDHFHPPHHGEHGHSVGPSVGYHAVPPHHAPEPTNGNGT